MIVFSKEWFEKYQRPLLWLLNSPSTKRWFRWILRIHNDLSLSEKICQIQPNNYKVFLGFSGDRSIVRLRADFRIHDKFSKRLYFAFKPLWWVMHAWDWAFADSLFPLLSFGFSTLTVFPQANPASTAGDWTVDQEYTTGSGVSWGTIRSAAGNNSRDQASDYVCEMDCDNVSNQFTTIRRGVTNFDTSTLTASAVISATTLSFHGNNKADANTMNPDVNIYAVTPSSNTTKTNSDYGAFGTTAYSSTINYSSWSTSAYNDFAYNTTGKASISLTGITHAGTREATHDVGNSAPTWTSSAFSFLQADWADTAGTSSDPKLVVTYTVPVPGVSFLTNFV